MVGLKVQFMIVYNTANFSLNGDCEQPCHLLFKKTERKKERKRKMSSICFKQLWGGQARILGTGDV